MSPDRAAKSVGDKGNFWRLWSLEQDADSCVWLAMYDSS